MLCTIDVCVRVGVYVISLEVSVLCVAGKDGRKDRLQDGKEN